MSGGKEGSVTIGAGSKEGSVTIGQEVRKAVY